MMSDAFEVLADIRRWACETLDASDAGRLCGMLSEVSRCANGLEAENEKMRGLMVEMYGFVCDVCELHPYVLTNAHIPEWQITDHSTPAERYAEKMRELGIEVEDE